MDDDSDDRLGRE